MTVVDQLLSDPPEQDYIVLAALKSPGKATLRGLGSPRNWNVATAYGATGGSVTFVGAPPVEFEVEIELFKPEHWIDWVAFAKLLAIPRGPVTTGLGISHPLLAVPPIQVAAVVVKDVTAFEAQDEGSYICTIKFIEFRKPVLALSKPIAAIPAASKALPTASDARDAEIAAKAAQFAALAGAP